MNVRLAATVAALAVGTLAHAQSPRAPRETVIAPLDKGKVTVEYGRPALKGRTVPSLLAELPAHRVWRLGVDQATTLTTDVPIVIGGKAVPAGKYTLYLYAPEGTERHLVVNSDLGVPLKQIFAAAPAEVADALWPRLGDAYSAEIKAKEVVRIPLKAVKAAEPMERLLIGLAPFKDGASSITITWGDQAYMADIRPGPAK
jgi:DUF2911 family protein